ncbi:DUF3991 domain-containing protein, partial [Ralstonia pseudosolanacearum]|uniref:DUF3991 domain-containing protein n=1 Tax=Ralstonia pseudosolanacearum TaxID=1310165 RepID=UPI003CE7C377
MIYTVTRAVMSSRWYESWSQICRLPKWFTAFLVALFPPIHLPLSGRGGAQAVEAGRAYLRDQRLIDDDSIGYAEQSQMLRYDSDGRLLFAGYDDQGRARNVTRRAINSRESVQKRDLKGSDKSFPPILPGDKGAPVWIVEG